MGDKNDRIQILSSFCYKRQPRDSRQHLIRSIENRTVLFRVKFLVLVIVLWSHKRIHDFRKYKQYLVGKTSSKLQHTGLFVGFESGSHSTLVGLKLLCSPGWLQIYLSPPTSGSQVLVWAVFIYICLFDVGRDGAGVGVRGPLVGVSSSLLSPEAPGPNSGRQAWMAKCLSLPADLSQLSHQRAFSV